VIPRVVFDTNTILSAILFPKGRLSWLRAHWASGDSLPLVSKQTAAELVRVLAYPKFHLSASERTEILGFYLPFCEVIEQIRSCPQTCRDSHDQMFLDLASSGNADVLVTGDNDLLSLDHWTSFSIESPDTYRRHMDARGST
jgi:putative PIN family toxin of toxin-antitoxin system